MALKIALTEAENILLFEAKKYSNDYRVRERAQIILMFSEGHKTRDIIIETGLSKSTVYSTVSAWEKEKMASLQDKVRSGTPKKISDEEGEAILRMVSEEAMTVVQILERHIANGGVPIHYNTLYQFLKKSNFVFKRTRHSLKKKK